jgi:hypothetical protein
VVDDTDALNAMEANIKLLKKFARKYSFREAILGKEETFLEEAEKRFVVMHVWDSQ